MPRAYQQHSFCNDTTNILWETYLLQSNQRSYSWKTTENNPVDDEKNDEETKQNEAAALVIEEKGTESVGDEKNGFVFETVDMREPLANINSKLLNGSEESSEEGEEAPNPALKFLKNPKTPASASKKQKKRERPTPSGTSDKKIEKKTKTA
jgi:hypothetical protein